MWLGGEGHGSGLGAPPAQTPRVAALPSPLRCLRLTAPSPAVPAGDPGGCFGQHVDLSLRHGDVQAAQLLQRLPAGEGDCRATRGRQGWSSPGLVWHAVSPEHRGAGTSLVPKGRSASSWVGLEPNLVLSLSPVLCPVLLGACSDARLSAHLGGFSLGLGTAP